METKKIFFLIQLIASLTALSADNLRHELLLKLNAINIDEKVGGTWSVLDQADPYSKEEQEAFSDIPEVSNMTDRD